MGIEYLEKKYHRTYDEIDSRSIGKEFTELINNLDPSSQSEKVAFKMMCLVESERGNKYNGLPSRKKQVFQMNDVFHKIIKKIKDSGLDEISLSEVLNIEDDIEYNHSSIDFLILATRLGRIVH